MSQSFPEWLQKYSETPVFTAETVPQKLTEDHDTKPGVWGKLVVLEGALDYVLSGPPMETQRLSAGHFGLIEPGVSHFVRPDRDAVFKVEFYRAE